MINVKDLTEEIALLLKDGFVCKVEFDDESIKMVFAQNQTFVVKIEKSPVHI